MISDFAISKETILNIIRSLNPNKAHGWDEISVSMTKLSDAALFTVVHEPNAAAEDMNHDLELISRWVHDWRMLFNPDPQKQAVELLLSKKNNEVDHPVILFNNIPVKKVEEHKHLGIILNSKLSFSVHIKSAISKTRKSTGLLKYLSTYLPRRTLNEFNELYP